ncbi:MAG: thiamine-phosphate kinase [Acidobacteria bacterium]|nr:MAG: thiamine-phosphate kinase [Acidobacteriota bacterium]
MTAFRAETEFVGWLRARVSSTVPRLKLGIGDDAAIVEVTQGRELVLKADMSIEGVHFTRRLHPARSVGHRALVRSLSDVAAMGGAPKFALVSLVISKATTRAWLREFYDGMLALAERFGTTLVGGDTAVAAGKTLIDVMIVGEAERGRALRRSGARPDDRIYVSGRLGLSALGLRLLRSGGGRAHQAAIRAHLYPEPRCALGRYLSRKRLASAAIDVSDGLSTDLAHLCEASGLGACVWSDRLPTPELASALQPSASDSLDLALNGGEDYELLFTVPPGKAAQVPARLQGLPLSWIGQIRRSKGVVLVRPDGKRSTLRPAGYNHFGK